MVLSFILGVTILFMLFGVLILYINKNMLGTKANVRKVFAAAGVVSIAVGTQMIVA
jgi:hypothetical protein